MTRQSTFISLHYFIYINNFHKKFAFPNAITYRAQKQLISFYTTCNIIFSFQLLGSNNPNSLTMPKNEKPVYLAPASEPFIKEYDEMFRRFAEKDKHTLVLTVHTDMVYGGEVGMLERIIMALQHQPHLIEKLLFCLDIKFTSIENSDIFIPESYWKRDAVYYRWFQKLASSPVMVFFINDEDARFYALAGDLLADNLLQVEPGDIKSKGIVCLEGDELMEVLNRLFTSCLMMLIYCHGSGFNPEPYIQSLIADLGLPLTYEEVYEKYTADIEKGIIFKAISVT